MIWKDNIMNSTMRKNINNLAGDVLRLYDIGIPIDDMRKIVDIRQKV